MCGICGQYNFDKSPISELVIRKMMSQMKHRGPDDDGVFLDGNKGFGFVRLSIIDLSSGGHQPMQDTNGRYTIVFNGEIYNYIELRKELESKGFIFHTKSDTEVLLNCFISWGKKCLELLDGMFAFVIYDKILDSIFGARDRFGVKPFYYIINDNCFRFSSDIASLVEVNNGKTDADYQSIFEYLTFNRTDHNENTFFKGIKKLQHGFCFSIEGCSFSLQKWYNLREAANHPFNNPCEFRELLNSSIGLRLRSDVPIGVCLSGGLDSSTITSLLIKDHNRNDLSTFSAIFNNGQFCDESQYINEYKSYLNNMFFVSPTAHSLFNDLDVFLQAHPEPVPSTSPYAQFKVMEIAKGKVKVTLDGQGADEQLAGYDYFYGLFFKDMLINKQYNGLINEIYCYLKNQGSLYGIKTCAYFLMPSKIKNYIRVLKLKYLMNDYEQRYFNSSLISDTLYASKNLNEALFDHFEYKLEHLLKWSDRNSMWFSIESRAPFLDYRLVERTLSSPNGFKIHNGITKYGLRESMIGILPEKIRSRKDKVGFCTPENEWLRSQNFQNMTYEILNSESLKKRNIIDSTKAISLYNKHLSGRINISKDIWKWINLELWFRKYID